MKCISAVYIKNKTVHHYALTWTSNEESEINSGTMQSDSYSLLPGASPLSTVFWISEQVTYLLYLKTL